VVGRAEVDVHADLSPFRRELNAAAARAGRDYGNTLAQNLDTRLQRTTRIFDRFWGSTLRGSRNDFLNFVGVVSAGVERLVGNVIGRGLGTIANTFDRLGDAIARFPSLVQFAGGFRLVGDNIRGLGAGGIDGLIVQLAALILAFNIGINVIGFFAGGLSAVTAGVTALAVGIGGALFGGIVALVPVVGALTAGIATLALAFAKMSKEQQAVFGPLVDLFKELRSGVQETLFESLGGQVDSLVTALRPLGPFLNSVAAEFADWVADVVGEIGPGGPLAATFASLGESIPDTFGRILDVLSSLGGSLLGLFDAATPAADRLLEAIERVLTQFSEWVNSVEGQEAVNEFLQQALDLLGLLFDIAGEVGTALANLWTEGGADAAQVLLDNIRDIVEEFNTWVSDEGGREALLTWFYQGVDAIQAIGTVLGTVVDLFDAMDTVFTRQGFIMFLEFLATGITALADLAELVQNTTIDLLLFASTLLENVGNALTTIGQMATTVWDGLLLAFQVVGIQAEAFWLALQTGAQTVAGALFQFDQTVREILSGVAQFISDTIDATGEAFAQLPEDVSRSLEIIGGALTDFGNSVSDAFAELVDSINNAIDRIIEAIKQFVSDMIDLLGDWSRQVLIFMARAGIAFLDLRKTALIALRDLVQNVRNATDNTVSALRRLPAGAADAIGRFATSIQNGVNRAVGRLREFGSRAVGALSGLAGRFASIGISMMQGLFNGIVSRGSAIIGYLQRLAQQAASTFANILGIASPSKVFEEFGKNIVEGLVAGLDAGMDDVLSATNTLADAATFPTTNAPVSAMAAQAVSDTSGGTPVRATNDVGGITIVTPYANPRLVALEVMDELAARGK
jgi:hypothetical protein